MGPLAVRALRGIADGEADIVETASSGLALLDEFEGYDRAIVVDAILTGCNVPGTIIEFTFDELGPGTAPSLHQAGLPELAAMAARFGLRFPAEVRVIAVEVAGAPVFGALMSKDVAGAVAAAAERARDQLRRWAAEDGRLYEGGESGSCTTTTP